MLLLGPAYMPHCLLLLAVTGAVEESTECRVHLCKATQLLQYEAATHLPASCSACC